MISRLCLFMAALAISTMANFSDQDYNENSKLMDKKETSTVLMFNFQASLIGIEVGGQNARCFAELGVDKQGIILDGIHYKF